MLEIILKEPTSIEAQLNLLENRGCIVTDRERCAHILESIKYYRFTAYFLPFKTPDNTYLPDTSFEKVFQIYEFDRKLRNLLFAPIEEIEIYLRAHISNYLALKYGSECYTDPSIFNSKHIHDSFTSHYHSEIESNKNIPFVKHHLETYDGHFPIWVLTELFTFGMLSHLYSDLKTCDQKYIANSFFCTNYNVLRSRLRCCTDLRNICAHYGRLYYRIFTATPAGYENIISKSDSVRLWGAINVVKDLYPDDKKWNLEYFSKIKSLIKEYSQYIDLNHIAFPDNWENILIK